MKSFLSPVIGTLALVISNGCEGGEENDSKSAVNAEATTETCSTNCELNAQGVQDLDCFCKARGCPESPAAFKAEFPATTLWRLECGDETEVLVNGYLDTELVRYAFDGDGQLAGASVAPSFECPEEFTVDFPSLSTCSSRCLIAFDGAVADEGECLSEELLSAGLGGSAGIFR